METISCCDMLFLRFSLLTYVITLLVLSTLVRAPLTHEEDHFMWRGAQDEYRRAHKGDLYSPVYFALPAYEDIPHLEEHAYSLASHSGILKGAMLIGSKGNHADGTRAIWFSTIIHHQDKLGRRMDLYDKLGLVLWRLDRGGRKIVSIDLVQDRGLRWGLQDLEKVLRRF